MISYTELDHSNEDINRVAELINSAMDEIIDPNDFMFERVAKYLIEHGACVKHGYWKEVEIPLTWCEDDVDIVYECSLCGENSPGKSPFCPCCGGKMDLKDKE